MLLDDGYNKMIHVTCCAHGIHNLLKILPELYPKVHELVCTIKHIYVNATTKRNRWKEIINVGIKMPIRYVETRWCSWLEAVLYFTQHLHREAVKKAMKDILETDPKSDSAKSVLVLLRDEEVEDGIKFIQENFISFGKLIRLCEKQDTTLEEAVEKIESMNFEYNNELSMPDIFKDEFDEIFAKNNGFQAVLKLINGEKTDNFVNMTEED